MNGYLRKNSLANIDSSNSNIFGLIREVANTWKMLCIIITRWKSKESLLYFSDEEIRFKVKSRILSVSGKNLSLVETSERDAVISGIVEKVDYV